MQLRALASGLAALTLTTTGTALVTQATGQPAMGDDPPLLSLSTPKRVIAYSYRGEGGKIQTDLYTTATLRTGTEPFEIRASRTSYADPLSIVWKRTGGDVSLPSWVMPRFGGLAKFFVLTVKDGLGDTVATRRLAACPNGFAQRVVPDAVARNHYPMGCPINPFTLGSVMGIEQGWASGVDIYPTRPLRLKGGKYVLEVRIAPRYQTLFELPADTSLSTSKLVVKQEDLSGPEPEPPHGHRAHQPAAQEPTGPAEAPPAGPRPDLRSLPAWGMRISPNGNRMQFSATVWNGGTSPLVVDGFRRGHQKVMDAYQYFFDTDLNQVGYEQIGEMEWDPRHGHHHWHFRDFARYRLLTSDLQLARRSKKEAFCLANTDAVDYTIPEANWKPEGSDLETACGDLSSQSVREELSVGSGDTYSQIRAGQSFNLEGLPNGTYYIQVQANPWHRLRELDLANNDSLREVVIGGVDGARTVEFFPVDLVDDHYFLESY